MPPDVNPDTNAGSKVYPDNLVSLAIIAITKIVQHFPEPDRRTVSPIQKKYAKKDNEEPLATKWINYP